MSRLTGPAHVNIIGRKMTALIDMLELVKKSTDQKYRSIDKDHILEASIILKRFQFEERQNKKRR